MADLYVESQLEQQIEAKIQTELAKNSKNSTYTAEVLRRDAEGTWWTRFVGNTAETPVIVNNVDVSPGDIVYVTVDNDEHISIVNTNVSNPPMSGQRAQNEFQNISQMVAPAVGLASSLAAYGITPESISSQHGYFEDLTAKKITVEDLAAARILVNDLTVENITAASITSTVGYFGGLEAENITVSDLKATKGFVADLTANNITAQNIVSDHAAIETLEANKIDVDDFTASTAAITGRLDAAESSINSLQTNSLTANSAVILSLQAKDAAIDEVLANKATIASLNAATARIGAIEADYLVADDMTAEVGRVNTLLANYATIERLETAEADIDDLAANKANVTDLTAATARIGTIETDYLKAADMTAEVGRVDTLLAGKASVNDLTAATGRITTLESSKADISLLESDYITAANIAANYAEIDFSNVTASWIQNGVIKNGAISNAMINSVSANKLTAGTIDASVIDVTNLNAKNIKVEKINGVSVSGKSIADALEQHESDISDLDDKIDSEVDALNDRIDGAIETFTGTAVPTLSNAPAEDWTDYDIHVGDVYYVVNPNIPQNGYCYRFTFIDDEYSWQLIKDSDVTAALARLQTAEGNIATIQSFDQEIATFKTETESELSTLMTRSTTLETNVQTAQATANGALVENVQLWYTKANTTAPNKPTSHVSSTATTGGAWTTKVPVYSATYPHYFYCYQYELADGTYKWSDVVYDVATTENQATSRSAESKIDNLEIGGRNLIRWSAFPSEDIFTHNVNITGWNGLTSGVDTLSNSITHDGYNSIHRYRTGTTATSWSEFKYYLRDGVMLEVGSEYTASIWIYKDPNVTVNNTNSIALSIRYYSESQLLASNYITLSSMFADAPYGEWTRLVNTFEVPSAADGYIWAYYYITSPRDMDFYLTQVKVEKGSKATDWSPAPEDVQAGIDNAQATADKNVKSSIQLWYTKANDTAPAKPTSVVSSTATTGGAWTTKVPVYSASYPKYFYCWQYELADGTYKWSDVVEDKAMAEVQSTSRTAAANASSALTQVATKVETSVFNETKQTVDENSNAITTLSSVVQSTGAGVLDLFSMDIWESGTTGTDVVGRTYEQLKANNTSRIRMVSTSSIQPGKYTVTQAYHSWWYFFDDNGGMLTMTGWKSESEFELDVPSNAASYAVIIRRPDNATITDVAVEATASKLRLKYAYASQSDLTSLTTTVNNVSQTATSNSASITQLNTTVQKNYEMVASRGEQLVTNGSGMLGDNTNFSSWVYDPSVSMNGSSGSFTTNGREKVAHTWATDEFFPVNVGEQYLLSYDIKCETDDAELPLFYSYVNLYDIDKLAIDHAHVHYPEGTMTTLARDLNNGDTEVYLTNIDSSFVYTSGRTGFAFWNYENSTGYAYPVGIYTRYVYHYYYDSQSSIDTVNNKVTLTKPWTSGPYPAGTPVSQSLGGANFVYVAARDIRVPIGETHREGTIGPGLILATAYPESAPYKFREAAAYAKIGFLWNYQAKSNAQIWIANVSFAKNVAAKAELDTLSSTVTYKFNTVEQTLEGINTSIGSIEDTLEEKADGSTLSSLSAKVNTMSDTVDGHTQTISSVQSTQTTMGNTLKTATKSTVQLWYSKADTTPPAKPTSHVSSTATTGGAWTTAVPAYSSSYPNYFYCYEWQYTDNSYGWSGVTRDIAMGETQERARTAESKIDNLEIGGRNLLLGTSEPTSISTASNGIYMTTDALKEMGATNEVTISFDVMSTQAQWLDLYFRKTRTATGYGDANSFYPAFYLEAADTWYHFEYTHSLGNDPSNYGWMTLRSNSVEHGTGVAKGTVTIKNMMLEKGNRASAWQVAPEDIQADIDNAGIETTNILRQKPSSYKPASYNVYSIKTTVTLQELGKNPLTIQLWDVVLDENATGIRVYWGGGSINLTDSLSPDENGYICFTFTPTQAQLDHAHAAASHIIIYNFPSGHSGANLSIGKWKLQRGAKATSWSLAPEDILRSSIQLWITRADSTVPYKPTSKVTTSNAGSADMWNLVVPTYNASYPHYFYCYQYELADGTCDWSDVVYDAATTENQAMSRAASAGVSTLTTRTNQISDTVDGHTSQITHVTKTANASGFGTIDYSAMGIWESGSTVNEVIGKTYEQMKANYTAAIRFKAPMPITQGVYSVTIANGYRYYTHFFDIDGHLCQTQSWSSTAEGSLTVPQDARSVVFLLRRPDGNAITDVDAAADASKLRLTYAYLTEEDVSEFRSDYATFKQTVNTFQSTIGTTYATKTELSGAASDLENQIALASTNAELTKTASGDRLIFTENAAPLPLIDLEPVYGESVQDGTPTPEEPKKIYCVGAGNVFPAIRSGRFPLPSPFSSSTVGVEVSAYANYTFVDSWHWDGTVEIGGFTLSKSTVKGYSSSASSMNCRIALSSNTVFTGVKSITVGAYFKVSGDSATGEVVLRPRTNGSGSTVNVASYSEIIPKDTWTFVSHTFTKATDFEISDILLFAVSAAGSASSYIQVETAGIFFALGAVNATVYSPSGFVPIASSGSNFLDESLLTNTSSNLVAIYVNVPNGTYTVSSTCPLDPSAANILAAAGYLTSYSGMTTDNSGVSNGISRTLEVTDGVITLFHRKSSSKLLSDYENWINFGSEPMAYEPYREPYVTYLDLQGNELHGLDDTYRDILRIDESGHAVIEKRCGKVVIDGTYASYFSMVSGNSGCLNAFYFSKLVWNDIMGTLPQKYLTAGNSMFRCDRLPIRASTGYTSSATPFITAWGDPSATFIMGFDSSVTTKSEAASWLDSNPVTIIYPLDSPYTIDLGHVDLPETFDGGTVYVDAEVRPVIGGSWWTKAGYSVGKLAEEAKADRASAGTLAPPYTELEWVESDGTQFVYTNWHPPIATWGFEADFIIYNTFNSTQAAWNPSTNKNNAGFLFGVRNATKVNDIEFGTYSANGFLRIGGSASVATSETFKKDKTRQTVKLRGTTLTHASGATSTVTRVSETAGNLYCNMAVFAYHEGLRKSATGGLLYPSSARIYSLKFFDGDELAMDLVGAKRKSDGMTGLYDKVANHFYPARGLLCGEEVGDLGIVDTVTDAIAKRNVMLTVDNRTVTRMWEAEAPTLDRLDDGQQVTVTFTTNVGNSSPDAIVAAGYDDYVGWDETHDGSVGYVYLKLTLSDGSKTEWIPCYYAQGTRLTSHYGSGTPVLMTYHEDVHYGETAASAGTLVMRGWWADPNYDSNTTYSKFSDTVVAGKNGLRPYTLCMKDDEGNWTSIVNQATTGFSDKTCYTGGLQLGGILYHATNATYAAGANGGQVWESYGGIDFRYSANGIANGATTTLQYRKPIYLVGTLDEDDGLFYLDTTKWWTQDTFQEGRVYVQIGTAYSSYYAIFLAANNPAYVWDPTAQKLVEFTYSRIKKAETAIVQTNDLIGFTANNEYSSLKEYADGIVAEEASERDAKILASANAINLSVSQNYASKASLDTRVHDEDTFLRRQLPSTVHTGAARIASIKGNTVKWNQLAKNGNFNTVDQWEPMASSACSVTASNGVLKLTINNNTENARPNIQQTFTDTPILGHVYLAKVEMRFTSSKRTTVNFSTLAGFYVDRSYLCNGQWYEYNEIRVANNENYARKTLYISQHVSEFDNGDTFEYRNYNVFDLTLMFGAGNEPATVAEFEALFPEPYYPYDPGSLLSVNVEGMKAIGFNQWDEEWEVGAISSGTPATSANAIRSKNYCPCISGQTYYGKCGNYDNGYYLHIWWYDSQKNWISGNWVAGATAIAPSNAAFFKLSTNTSTYVYGTVYNDDICINISDPDRNGEYEPYAESTREFDLSGHFPTGLKSAGTVYDELDFENRKAVTRIGTIVVDGSTVAFGSAQEQSNGKWVAYLFVSGRNSGSSANYNINSNYTDIQSALANCAENIGSICINTLSNLCIGVGEQTDANTAKSAANAMVQSKPLVLYYELATPITQSIDPSLNFVYEVEAGGTEFVLVDEEQAAPQSVPVPFVFEYGLSAMDALADAVVRMSSAESAIVQNADNISLKVSQTDYNGQTVASLINQSPDEIKIQANHVQINGATTFVSGGTTSTLGGYLSDNYDSKGSAQTAVDNLEFGGRNLLRVEPSTYNQTAYLVYQIDTTESLSDIGTNPLVLQLWGVELDSGSTGLGLYWGGASVMPTARFLPDANGYACVKFTPTQAQVEHAAAVNKFIRIYNYANGHTGSSLTIEKWKLERGNKPTDWSQAQEDLQAGIDAATAVVTVYPTAIDYVAGTATLAVKLHVNGEAKTPTSYKWTKGTSNDSIGTGSTLTVSDLDAVYNCLCTWS